MAEAKKQLPVSFEEQFKAMTESIKSRVEAPSGDQIVVSNDKTFTFPDGTLTPGPFHAVILDFSVFNTFYKSRYDPKNPTPPACFAVGQDPTTTDPSPFSPDKQSEHCATCANNQFGSDGAKGKACRNHRMLALVVIQDPENIEITEDTPVWPLKLSPTAIRAFEAYISKLAKSFNCPPIGVVSQIGFDPNVDYASIRFGKPVPNTALKECFGLLEAARERLASEEQRQKEFIDSFAAQQGAQRPAARAPGRPNVVRGGFGKS